MSNREHLEAVHLAGGERADLLLLAATLATIALSSCAPSGSSPPPPSGPGPTFVIASPRDGGTVSGATFFAVDLLQPAAVQGVSFTAGGTALTADAPGEDAFKVFLAPREFPDGPLALRAVVTGKDGARSEQRITVHVVAAPPSTTSVAPAGATLGTLEASGAVSTLTIPGGVAQGALVTFTARSKAEVKAATGIDYDALGVTFLGAQEIDSSLPIEAPVGVSSGGFGPMVQPGQAVLNYMILPDGDGDGIGELVAVNTATVAPGGEIASNPVPQLQLGASASAVSGLSARAVLLAQGSALGGPPGAFVEVEATGFNPFSPLGSLALFHSQVSGQEIELPALVNGHFETPNATPTIGFYLPVLPAGGATVSLRNVSAGTALPPLSLTIESPPALPGEPAAVIDGSLAEAIRVLSQDPSLQATVSRLTTLRGDYAALAANPSPVEAQILHDVAVLTANSNLLALLGQLDAPASVAARAARALAASCTAHDFLQAETKGLAGGYFLASGAFIFQVALAGGNPPLGSIGGAELAAGALLYHDGFGQLLGVLKDCLTPPPPPLPPLEPKLQYCNLSFVPIPATSSPSPGGLRASAAAAAAVAPPPMTGMGSVTPPGGDGCGSALGDSPATAGAPRSLVRQALAGPGRSGLLAGPLGDLSGRFIVKVFYGAGRSVPFSGVSDASGYFYIPVIPAGQPYQAIAFDKLTGQTRSATGVGPEVGQSTVMAFDFFTPGATAGTVLAYDTNSQGTYGGVDLYLFQGKAGDVVNLAVFSELSPLNGVGYQLSDASGFPLVNAITSGGHYLETGLIVLPADGLYTFSLDGSVVSGGYTLGLALIDPPTLIDVALPLVGNLATLGDSQFFSFAGAAGDLLRVTFGPDGSSVLNADLLVREPQASVPFFQQHALRDVAITSTRRSVSTSLTLTMAGEHLLQVHHADPFEPDLQKYMGAYRVDIAKTP